MKALVLGGGASKGAYVGGMLEYMVREMGVNYEYNITVYNREYMYDVNL